MTNLEEAILKEFERRFSVDYEKDGTPILQINTDEGRDYQTFKKGLPIIADWWLSKLSTVRKEHEEQAEKERWWSPCDGCKGGHPSFWKTVVESPQWKLWEKEQNRRFASESKEGCFDYDESRECGWLGYEHFQEFLKFASLLSSDIGKDKK